MRPDWAASHPEAVSRLIVALDKAARWCDVPENHDALAETLAEPRYLAAPIHIVRHVLSGEFGLDAAGNRRIIENYFRFHGDHANYPDPDQALWIYSQMIRWGQIGYSGAGAANAASAYRPDLYRLALGGDAVPLPDATSSEKAGDRFMDGHAFDPSDIPAYVRGFAVRSKISAVPSSEEA